MTPSPRQDRNRSDTMLEPAAITLRDQTRAPRPKPVTGESHIFTKNGGVFRQKSDGTIIPLDPELYVTVAVANAGTPDGDAYITLTVGDSEGNALTGYFVLDVWISESAYAAPSDLGTLTATTGTLLVEQTDDALAKVVTNSSGVAVLNLDLVSDDTAFVQAIVLGRVGADSEAITGN